MARSSQGGELTWRLIRKRFAAARWRERTRLDIIFERTSGHLLWLLKEDRWTKVRKGFDDVNLFLDSIRLGSELLTTVKETRRAIVREVKRLQPEASNRRIAKALGVDESTVREDFTGRRQAKRAGNPAGQQAGRPQTQAAQIAVAGNPAPTLTGAEAAKLARNRESRKARDIEAERRRMALPASPSKVKAEWLPTTRR